MPNIVRISIGQYLLKNHQNWNDYKKYFTHLIESASDQHANMIIMPEYFGLSMNGCENRKTQTHFENVLEWHDRFLELSMMLAKQKNIYIQPGSMPVKHTDGTWRNRAYFFSPNGHYDYQDKIYLTKFEKNLNLLTYGDEITIFNTIYGKIAIAICYDVEFPEIVQKMALAGVKMVLVPSSTETLYGYHRVHISCRARAIEQQIYLANSCTIGACPWSDVVDQSAGCAGIYTPADVSFNTNGIHFLGAQNYPDIYALDVDLDKIDKIRNQGEVENFADQRPMRVLQIVESELK